MPKPKQPISSIRWGKLAHGALNAALAAGVALLVKLELTPVAIGLVLLSKWRVFAVQPRHWLINLRSNSPDIIVGLSFVVFMAQAASDATLALWALLYGLWLLWLKPQTDPRFVGAQALASLFMGLTALFWMADYLPEALVVLGTWFIAYVSAQHYLNGYDENLYRVMSAVWGLFMAELAWIMHRWLVVYPVTGDILIPQISVVGAVSGYILATLYHLRQSGKLNRKITRRYVLVGYVILVAVIIFSKWTNEL